MCKGPEAVGKRVVQEVETLRVPRACERWVVMTEEPEVGDAGLKGLLASQEKPKGFISGRAGPRLAF